jgi:hypothetical protein
MMLMKIWLNIHFGDTIRDANLYKMLAKVNINTKNLFTILKNITIIVIEMEMGKDRFLTLHILKIVHS